MSPLRTETILEHVRESLLDVKQYVEQDHNVAGEFTDFAAQLNAIHKSLEDLNEIAKGKIKTDLVSNNRIYAEGDRFLGELQRSDTERLNTKKVREFLGKRVHQFLIFQPKVSLVFKAKGV